MRVSVLVAVLTLLSGCLSSSPRVMVWSEDATVLSVQYAGGPDAIVEALQARGCVPTRADRFQCPVAADGRQYTAGVTLTGLATPLQPRAQDGERTESPQRDENQTTAVTQAETLPPPLSQEAVAVSHEFPTATRAPLPLIRLRSTTRIVGDSGELVRLGGTESAALRAALSALVVQDLEVVRASYDR